MKTDMDDEDNRSRRGVTGGSDEDQEGSDEGDEMVDGRSRLSGRLKRDAAEVREMCLAWARACICICMRCAYTTCRAEGLSY